MATYPQINQKSEDLPARNLLVDRRQYFEPYPQLANRDRGIGWRAQGNRRGA